MIEKFAGYGFNKSHSTAYALIAYMTAYLKAHYPVEFMAALLSGDIDGPQLQEEGLAGRAPGRLPADGHRGRAAGREPLATPTSPWPTARSASGCRRSRAAAARRPRRSSRRAAAAGRSATCSISASGSIRRTVNRAAIETLIKAGAFDSLGAHAVAAHGRDRPGDAGGRRGCTPIAAAARRACSATDDDEPAATAAASLPDVPEWDERERLAKEKEVLGFYLSSHPLAEHEKTLATYCSHTTAEAAELAAPHRGRCSAACSRRSSSRTPKNPQPGQHQPSTPCSTWKTWTGIDALHRLARAVRQLRRAGPGRRHRWSCAARSTSGPAARRPT